MIIRRAQEDDIPQILGLLKQVLELHAKIRPDIFLSGVTKYTKEDLIEMVDDDIHNIFVAVDDNQVLGYVFYEIRSKTPNMMVPHTVLYIDDLCVDERYRRKHIGETIFEFIKEEASRLECYEITLSCWEGNDIAKKFYEKMGMKTRNVTMEYIIK